MAVDSLGALFGLAPLNRFTFDGADALPSTEADGGAGLESTRTMRFVVEVWLQESDDERRFREIDRLEAVVCTVAQAPPGLAGAATVGLTQIVAGRNDPTVRNPWVCRMLAGQTSYLIPGLDARDRFADWG
jgi:hypothetical protein